MIPGQNLQYMNNGLINLGYVIASNIYGNLSPALLYEEAIRRHEAVLADKGPLVVRTGKYTGRSPNDKFIVEEPTSRQHVWWGNVNHPYDPQRFEQLLERYLAHVRRQDLFVRDCYAGADPGHALPIRIITDSAWQSLFAYNMFIQPPQPEPDFIPQFTLISAPSFQADPVSDGTNSEVFIIVDFSRKIAVIGGSSYAGEIKKTIFTVMNYLSPLHNILSMHCSANVGQEGDVALFFGLSGTGKTTLSADTSRSLIGDDEHGWSDNGIYNFEGGCYAKVIRLSEEDEPQIYQTTRTFGTILENVVVDVDTRTINLDDSMFTENTRASYPLSMIPNHVVSGRAGHPKNIIFLTADAFGVLPPVAKLTPEQALYHFLSGYTAKIAGTEKGVVEPQATFSACFGAPFMVHHPTVYARLLKEKIEKHQVQCWLLNTGWTGGPYGTGSRMKIAYSRAMVDAILSPEGFQANFEPDEIFGVMVPDRCPNVPSEVLKPKNTWHDDEAYSWQATRLASMFIKNFEQFESAVDERVLKAGPRIPG